MVGAPGRPGMEMNERSANDRVVAPWGQTWNRLSKDMLKAAKPVAEGGTGVASQFWEWCEEQWKPYW